MHSFRFSVPITITTQRETNEIHQTLNRNETRDLVQLVCVYDRITNYYLCSWGTFKPEGKSYRLIRTVRLVKDRERSLLVTSVFIRLMAFKSGDNVSVCDKNL